MNAAAQQANFWDQVLQCADRITREVGARLLQDFGHSHSSEKADGSLVTKSDEWADARLRELLAAAFATHGLLSEETIHIFPATDWCWIIDPIDGTTNFTRGLPIWGISLGLLYRGTPVFGYVYFPVLNQAVYGYWAGDSGLTMPSGAFRDGQPIYTSVDEPSGNHFFNLCARSLAVLQNPFPAKIRMLGATTYSLLTVATGAALGSVEATPKIWDLAATWVIVLAAGGAWHSLSGDRVFPLEIGRNYGSQSYATLVVSRSELLPYFEPLVRCIVKPNC